MFYEENSQIFSLNILCAYGKISDSFLKIDRNQWFVVSFNSNSNVYG